MKIKEFEEGGSGLSPEIYNKDREANTKMLAVISTEKHAREKAEYSLLAELYPYTEKIKEGIGYRASSSLAGLTISSRLLKVLETWLATVGPSLLIASLISPAAL